MLNSEEEDLRTTMKLNFVRLAHNAKVKKVNKQKVVKKQNLSSFSKIQVIEEERLDKERQSSTKA